MPVLMCNKSGQWNSPVQDASLGIPQGYRFSGRSIILDADGSLSRGLDDEEALLVGDVRLDPALKKQTRPPKYSRYIYPWPFGREILRLMEWRGRLVYTFSRNRKEKAAKIS